MKFLEIGDQNLPIEYVHRRGSSHSLLLCIYNEKENHNEEEENVSRVQESRVLCTTSTTVFLRSALHL